MSSAALAALPPDVRSSFLDVYSQALSTAFRVAAYVSILAFAASWFIKELPMRSTVTTEGIGEAFGSPRSGDSLAEMGRAAQRPGWAAEDGGLLCPGGDRGRRGPAAGQLLGAGGAPP